MDLEAALKAEREAVLKAKEENEALAAKLQEVVSRYKQLQQQSDSASLVASLEKDKEDLIGKLKTVVAKYRELQKQHHEAPQTDATLAERVKMLENELASEKQRNLSVKNDDDAADVQTLREEIKKKENEKQEVVNKLQEVILRYRKLQQFVQETQTSADASTARVNQLQEELDAKECSHQRALTELQDTLTNQMIDAVKSKMDAIELLRSELEESNASHALLVQKNQELQSSIDNKNEEISSHKSKIAQLEFDLATSQALSDRLLHEQATNNASESRLKEELSMAIEEKLEKIKCLQSDLETTIERVSTLTDENQVLVDARRSCEAQVADLQAALNHEKAFDKTSTLESELSANIAKIEVMEASLKTTELTNATLLQTQKDLEAALYQLETDHEALQVEKAALEGNLREKTELVTSLEVRQMTFEALQMQLQDIEAANAKHEATQNQLEVEFQMLRTTHECLLEEKKALIEERSSLEAALQAKTELVATLEEQVAGQLERIEAASRDRHHELQSEMQKLEESRAQLMIEKQALEDDKMALEMSLQIKSNLVTSLEARLEAQVVAIESANSEHEANTKQLRASIQSLEAAHAQVLMEKSLLEDNLNAKGELASKLEERTAELAIAQEKLGNVIAKITALETQLEEVETARAKIQLEFEALLAEKTALEASMVERLASLSEDYNSRVFAVQEQLEATIAEKAALDLVQIDAQTAYSKLHHEYESLQEQYDSLSHQHQQIREELDAAAKAEAVKISALQAELDEALASATSKQQRLEAALTELQDEYASIQKELATKLDIVAELEDKVDHLDATNQSLEDELSEVKNKLAALQREKITIEQEVAAKQEAITRWKTRAEHLEEELSEAQSAHEAAIAEYRNSYAKLQIDYERLLESKATLEDGLSAKDELVALLHEKSVHIESLEANLDSVQKELNDAKHAHSTALDDLEALQVEKDRLTNSLNAANAEIEALKATLKEANQEFHDLETNHAEAIKELEGRIYVLTDESEVSNAAIAAKTSEITKLTEELDHLRQEFAKLRQSDQDEHEALDQERTNLLSKIDGLETTLAELYEEKSNLESKNESCLASMQSLELEFKSLRNKHEHERQAAEKERESICQNHAAAMNGLMEDLRILNEEKSSLENKSNELQASVNAASATLEDLSSNLEDLRTDYSKAKDELKASQNENYELTEQIAGQTVHIAKLHEEVLALQEELEAVNASRIELQALIDDKATARDELAVKLENLRAEHKSALKKLKEEHAAEIARLQDSISTLQTEKVKLEEQIEAISSSKVAELESLRNQQALVLSELEEKFAGSVAEFQDSLSALESEKAAMEEQIVALSSSKVAELENLRTKHNSILEEHQEKYAADMAELHHSISTLESDKVNLEAEVDAISSKKVAELENMRCEHKRATDEQDERYQTSITQLQDAISALEHEKVRLEEQIHAISLNKDSQLENLRSEQKVALDEVEARHNADVSRLQDSIANLESEKTHLEEQIETLESTKALELENLTSQQQQVYEELEKKHAGQVAELRHVISTLESEKADLEAKIETLASTRDDLENELEMLRATSKGVIDNQAQEIIALKEYQADQASATAALEQQIAELHEEIQQAAANLQAQEMSNASEVQALRSQIDSVRESAREKISALDAEIQTLLQQHTAYEATIERLTESISHLTDEKESLTNTANDLESEVKKKSAIESSLSSRIEELEQECEERDTVVNELTSARNQLQALESQLADRVAELDQRELEKKSIALAIAEKEELIAALTAELQATKDIVVQNAASAQEESEQLEAKINDLQYLLDAARKNLAKAEATIDDLEQQKGDIVKSHEELSKDKMALESHLEKKRELVTTHVNDLDNVTTERNKLRTQLNHLQQQYHELEAQLEQHRHDAQSRLTVLENEHKDAISRLENARDALMSEMHSLRESLSEQVEICAALRRELEQTAAEKASIGAEMTHALQEKNARVEELEHLVATIKADNHQSLEALEDDLRSRLVQAEKALNEAQAEWEATRAKAQATFDKEKADMAQELASKDELVASLKDKMEEVLRRYKKLQEQAMELKSRYDEKSTELATLEAKQESQAVEFQAKTNALSSELNDVRSRNIELEAVASTMEDAKQQHDVQINTLKDIVEAKERANEDMAIKLKDLVGRYHELEATLAQVQSSASQSTTIQSELLQQNNDLANEATSLRTSLLAAEARLKDMEAQLIIESEATAEAREALEGYKRRAHVALKKATVDSKSFHDERQALQDEIAALKARLADLEAQLASDKEMLTRQVQAAEAARIDTIVQMEATAHELRATIASMTKQHEETIRVHESTDLQWQSKLQARQDEVHQATQLVAALQNEVEGLKKDIQSKSDVAREMLKVKDNEIRQLMQRLDEATQAAQSHEPSKLEDATPRMTPPTSLTAVDVQVLTLARIQASHEEEAARMRRQIIELEDRLSTFQKQYEEARSQLNASKLELARHQEIGCGVDPTMNLEYLKNVILKYFITENPREKEQLIPVLSTILHFSPEELEQIHHVSNSANAGVLGSVFSYFG